MRIRSIKYKSGNNSSSHSELPQRGLLNCKIQAISTQNLHKYSYIHKQSTKGFKNVDNSRTLLTTLQCSNFQENNNFQPKKNNFLISKSVDKNIKKTSIHERRQRNQIIDKENRSCYLRFAKNTTEKSPQCQLLKHKVELKEDKITIKIDNFCSNKQQRDNDIETNPQPVLGQKQALPPLLNEQKPNQIIILGQNLTFGIDTLQKQIQQIQEHTRQEIQSIDKIRQQLCDIGPKIQRQLDDIIKTFHKGVQGLQSYLRRQKSQKCTQLVNWRGVISSKREQCQGQFGMVDELNERMQRLQHVVGQRGIQFKEQNDGRDY